MGRFNKLRGQFRYALRQALAERDGLRCGICKEPVDSFKEMTIDHIIPLCQGGTIDYHNLQLAHDACNLRKGGLLGGEYKDLTTRDTVTAPEGASTKGSAQLKDVNE